MKPRQFRATVALVAFALAAAGPAAGLAAPPEVGADKEKERVIAPKDLLTVSISDLEGPGINTVVKVTVDEKGRVTLPRLKNPVTARGLTCAKLEQAIVKAYHDENLLRRATVTVKFRDPNDKEPPGL